MKLIRKDLIRKTYLAAACVLLISAAGTQAAAQSDAVLANVMKMTGKLIAQGKNNQPIGQFNLKTYRVEEISLQKSVAVELQGKLVNVDRAWRITVTGGPFPV